MIDEIKIKFLGGTHIDEAKTKAKEIALKHKCTCSFRFNDETIIINEE